MAIHPFEPLKFKETRKLLIGTLPPKTAPYYFSNSPNTRLWDILKSINNESDAICHGSNFLNIQEKHNILQSLYIGIADIIYEYEKEDDKSTEDNSIIPLAYRDLLSLAENSNIYEFIFVYQSAYKWFLHSLTGEQPIQLKCLNAKFKIGYLSTEVINNKKIDCYLVPSPLNRGRKGETLEYKIKFYKEVICRS